MKLNQLLNYIQYGDSTPELKAKSQGIRNVIQELKMTVDSIGKGSNLEFETQPRGIRQAEEDLVKTSVLKAIVKIDEDNMELNQQPKFIASPENLIRSVLKADILKQNEQEGLHDDEEDMSSLGDSQISGKGLGRSIVKSIHGDIGIRQAAGGYSEMKKRNSARASNPPLQVKSIKNEVELSALNQSITKTNKVVIFPQYELDEVGSPNYYKEIESSKPDPQAYCELGYDSKNHKEQRHYRLVLSKPLEETDYLGNRSFKNEPIHLGKQITEENKSWLSKLLSRDHPYKEVGKFKGSFNIIKEETLLKIQNLDLPKKELEMFAIPTSVDNYKSNKMDKSVMVERQVVVRVYIVDAIVFDDIGEGQKVDPYIRIELGDKTIDVRIGGNRIGFESVHR